MKIETLYNIGDTVYTAEDMRPTKRIIKGIKIYCDGTDVTIDYLFVDYGAAHRLENAIYPNIKAYRDSRIALIDKYINNVTAPDATAKSLRKEEESK